MKAEQRLSILKAMHITKKRLEEDRKGINNDLQAVEHDKDERLTSDDGQLDEKQLKSIHRKGKKLCKVRSEINSKIKALGSDFESCLYGEGDNYGEQMHFEIEADPDTMYENVKSKSLEKPKKKEKAKKES